MSIKNLDSVAPEIRRTEGLSFTFQFRPTVARYCVVIQNEERKRRLREMLPAVEKVEVKVEPAVVEKKERKRKRENPFQSECMGCGSMDLYRDEETGELVCIICEKDTQMDSKEKEETTTTEGVTASQLGVVVVDEPELEDPMENDTEKVTESSESQRMEESQKEDNNVQVLESQRKEDDLPNQKGQEEDETKYLGGMYNGFNIFKYTLIVETLESSNGLEEEDDRTPHVISHYFGPRENNKTKEPKQKKSSKQPKAKKPTKSSKATNKHKQGSK